MKQIILSKEELLSNIIWMNRSSLTLNIHGEIYLIYKRVFNSLLKDISIPTFVVEREYQGRKTNWLAIPSSL